MLCTFTTETGDLIIQSDDIKSIFDHESGARLAYMMGPDIYYAAIQGTAAENRDRIQKEELDMIAVVESHRYETQKRLQAGYPVPPVARGKQ